MTVRTYAVLALLTTASLAGCGGGSSAGAPATAAPAPAAITGVDTPKSVSVVTAN